MKNQLLNSNSIGNSRATCLPVERLLHSTLVKQILFIYFYLWFSQFLSHVCLTIYEHWKEKLNVDFRIKSFICAPGTQRVISFLRQIVEHGGFYRTTDQAWVTIERIQFVGACNPPTDPGRKPLSHRFLRHVPVIYVDYPGPTSLTQIYGTFNRAMLRIVPPLRSYAQPLTDAMVEFYSMSQVQRNKQR